MRVSGAVLAVAFILFCGSAQAQSGSPEGDAADAQWSVVDVGGCHIVLNHGTVKLDANGRQFLGNMGAFIAIRWSGACDVNGLITGRGVLQVDYDAKVITGSNGLLRNVFEGQASQGRMEGLARYSMFEPNGDNGPLVLRNDGVGDVRWDVMFERGCITLVDGERQETACRPGVGDGLRDRYLASQGVPEASAPAAATAARGGRITAVATPAAQAGRNPFLNSCLSLKAPEGGREPGSWGATVWTIQNSCQTKLYVTWCADEDTRVPLRNVCDNKTTVTNELLAGGTIIFQSVVEELSIQAFACRAPDFARDVRFTEDRRLTATGCP